MIDVSKVEVMGIEGAIRGMRNPKNSWSLSDSDGEFLGENDMRLCTRLSRAGTEHRKFMRMIHVQMDVVAPLYWWKEFDTYKVGTVSNSCSTMHKLASKPITLKDFSIDDFEGEFKGGNLSLSDCFENVVADCEMYRQKYLETEDKRYWKAMIQLLPCSYNQRRTIDFNYEVALNILHQRQSHKLDEWRKFCDELLKLPYMLEFKEADS